MDTENAQKPKPQPQLFDFWRKLKKISVAQRIHWLNCSVRTKIVFVFILLFFFSTLALVIEGYYFSQKTVYKRTMQYMQSILDVGNIIKKDEVSLFALTSSFLISIFIRRLPINLAKRSGKFAGICIP